MRCLFSAVWLIASLRLASATVVQTPLVLSERRGFALNDINEQSRERKLHGRFLHITDIHPDPFYKVYSSTEADSACHRRDGPAGYYGAETTDCDSPLSLVNATFQWIAENLKDTIDFVIWTGDSARHDNDENLPRNEEQVLNSNRMLVKKLKEVFGRTKRDSPRLGAFEIPVIPTFGNNDILPHNIFSKGPNKWTRHYLEVWRDFIPEEQRHGFDRGGWFYSEVVPNKLAVFSLNTLYFFDSNSAVDGCAARREPGYQHLEWLRIQLSFLRQRGMKAILTGHVPPARTSEKSLWDETCWQKYTLWMQQYRDVVITSIYGHMNVEHFLLQDFHDIDLDVAAGLRSRESIHPKRSPLDEHLDISINTNDYMNSLRRDWSRLPAVPESLQTCSPTWKNDSKAEKNHRKEERNFYKKIGGQYAERFSVSQVSASVVPNYFPALRVYEYNISGLESIQLSQFWPSTPAPETAEFFRELDEEEFSQVAELRRRGLLSKKPHFTIPHPPSKNAPPGPAYSPQTFSFTGYKQYFSNLTSVNNDFESKWNSRHPRLLDGAGDKNNFEDRRMASISNPDSVDEVRWRNGKHHDKRPSHPPSHPLNFTFEIEYDTTAHDDWYGLNSGLITRNWVELAATVGEWTSASISKRTEGNDIANVEDDERYETDSDLDSDVETIDQGRNDKNKKKKKRKKKQNTSARRKEHVEETWYTFLSRAVVASLSREELKERFSS